MARNILQLTNVDPADSDYPSGRVRNNPGDNSGTPVNEALLGDMVQFFQKIMVEAGITPNQLPDNEYSGWQLYEAFLALMPTVPSWANYSPALSALDISDAAVIGGVTGTIAARWIKQTDGTIHIIIEASSIETLSNTTQIVFGLPFTIPIGKVLHGYNLLNYYNGSAYSAVEVSVNLNGLGAGTAFKVNKLDGSAFGAHTGGSFRFAITMELR